MSILHKQIPVPAEQVALQQKHRIDQRNHHNHNTDEALLVDILVEVSVLCAQGV